MSAKLSSLDLLIVGILLASASQTNAQPHTFTDLGTLPDRTSSSSARAINNAGQVVGYSSDSTSYHATLWNGTTATDLGTLGAPDSWAVAINNAGLVAGITFASDGQIQRGIVWNGATAIDLGTLPNGTY